MRKIIEKFKTKYLLVLVLPLAAFIFTKVSASDRVIIKTKEEYKKAVARAFLIEKSAFKIEMNVKHSDKFPIPSNVNDYCNIAEEGIVELLPQFYSLMISCTKSVSLSGNSAVVYLNIYKDGLTPKFHEELMNFVKTEGDKMYAQTKDKEQLVKKVSDKFSEMLDNRHPYFLDENSFYHYENVSGWNIMASLFYDYFGIDNYIVSGRDYYGAKQWNLINLGNKWYHVENWNLYDLYLISDEKMGVERSWNNADYPKASENYVPSSLNESAVIVPIIKETDIDAPFIPNDYRETAETPTPPTVNISQNEPTSWAKGGVDEAIANGIVPSSLQVRYRSSITREEFCELVVMIYEKMTGTTAPSGSNPFNDTNNEEIIKAEKLGIVKGIGNGKFGPTNLITREQIAVMFNNLLIALNKTPNLDSNYTMFADDAEISGWAKEAVQILTKLNIMNGVGNNKVNPKGNATIEQAILLGNKLYNLYK